MPNIDKNKFLNFEGVKILVQKIKEKIDSVKADLDTKINNKVEKDGSKVLSDNNFTNDHKNKLETQVLTEIPIASSTVLGGIKVGAGLEVGTDNKLKVSDNIAAGVGAVVYNKEQNLEESQKTQARKNIGAGTGFGDMKAAEWVENGKIKDTLVLNGVPASEYVLQEKLSNDLKRTKVDLLSVMRGKNRAYTFDTKEDLKKAIIDYLKNDNFPQATPFPLPDDPSNTEQKLYTGDILYIRAVNVPDYWWDENGTIPTDDPDVQAAGPLKLSKGWIYELEATTVNLYSPLETTEVEKIWTETWTEAQETPTV